MGRDKRVQGFTIIELLVVIVVIAILATISVVAYTGIQNRTNDSVVQSDLSNFAKKVQIVTANTGEYPVGGRTIATDGGSSIGVVTDAPVPNVDMPVSRVSYDEPTASGAVNFTYCMGTGVLSGKNEYVVSGRSKSGNVFQYSSIRGAEGLGSVTITTARACLGIDYPRSTSWGYSINQGGWQSWTE